jgi:hypothetical protein
VDHSAANPLHQGAKPAWLLRAGGDTAAGVRLCSVYPTLSCWPPVSGAAQAIQRAAIVSLLWLVVVAVFALAAARHLRARGWTVRIRAP